MDDAVDLKKEATNNKINPEQHASCCSKLFFAWLNPLLKLGATRPLTPSDIPNALDTDASKICHDKFDQFWQEEDLESLRNTPQHQRGVKSICRVARRFVGKPVLRSSLYYFISMILTFAPPFLLKNLVGHLEGKKIDVCFGCCSLLSVLLFFTFYINTTVLTFYNKQTTKQLTPPRSF